VYKIKFLTLLVLKLKPTLTIVPLYSDVRIDSSASQVINYEGVAEGAKFVLSFRCQHE
jgi:hypothetical protein